MGKIDLNKAKTPKKSSTKVPPAATTREEENDHPVNSFSANKESKSSSVLFDNQPSAVAASSTGVKKKNAFTKSVLGEYSSKVAAVTPRVTPALAFPPPTKAVAVISAESIFTKLDLPGSVLALYESIPKQNPTTIRRIHGLGRNRSRGMGASFGTNGQLLCVNKDGSIEISFGFAATIVTTTTTPAFLLSRKMETLTSSSLSVEKKIGYLVDSAKSRREALVWTLVDALWGDAGEYGSTSSLPDTTFPSRFASRSTALQTNRSETLDAWIRMVSNTKPDRAGGLYRGNEREERIRLEKEGSLSALRAATLACLLPGAGEDFMEALSSNKRVKTSSGDVCIDRLVKLLTRDQKEIDLIASEGDATQDWVVAFALYFWYRGSNMRTLRAVMEDFQTSRWGRDPKTQHDGLYRLLQRAAAAGGDADASSLLSCLDPCAYTSSVLNWEIPFFLGTILESAKPDLIPSITLRKLTNSFCFQLECAGLWEWAALLYSRLHAVDGSQTTTHLKTLLDLLHRNLHDLSPAKRAFLITKNRILSPYDVAQADAVRAKYDGNEAKEIDGFFQAKAWDDWCDAVGRNVACELVLLKNVKQFKNMWVEAQNEGFQPTPAILGSPRDWFGLLNEFVDGMIMLEELQSGDGGGGSNGSSRAAVQAVASFSVQLFRLRDHALLFHVNRAKYSTTTGEYFPRSSSKRRAMEELSSWVLWRTIEIKANAEELILALKLPLPVDLKKKAMKRLIVSG